MSENAPCGQDYPNLAPDDLQFLTNSEYAIRLIAGRRLRVRNGTTYLYVITLSGELILGDVLKARQNRVLLHHPDLVNGASVAYAGEIVFYGQNVMRWNNRSGHYLRNAAYNKQESDCIKQLLEGILGSSLPEQTQA